MDRKKFIKSCGLACIGSLTLGPILQSCTAVKMISGTIVKDDIVMNISDFTTSSGTPIKYVILHNDMLKFPICVYNINSDKYSALLMRCSHQGNELTAYGDKLQCSAHGSEFDKYGHVTNGPADKQLRVFPVRKESQQLKISIKAV